MATETVVSYHSSPSEEVEKQEVKKNDTECTSDPPKESVIKNPGESAAEPHLAKPAKDSNADNEPKIVAVSPTVEVPAAEEESITESTQEKVEVKQTEEDKKIEEAPVVEALDKAIKPEPIVEKVDILCEDKSEPEPAEKQGEEESIESKELKEVEKVADVPESLPPEVVEKIEEKVEEPLAEVEEATKAGDVVVVPEAENKPEAIEVKDLAVPLAESKLEATELKDVTVCEAQSKPEEITLPALVVELVEEVEAKSCTDKAKDSELPKEEVISTSESSDIVKSEAPVSQVEEENVDVCGKTYEGTEQTEPAKESVETLLDEKSAEPEKIEEKTEAPEEKSVVAEELLRSEEKPTEDSKTSVPTPQPAENVAEDEAPSRDMEFCGTDASPKVTKGVERTEAAEKIEEEAEVKLVEEKQVDEKIKETVEATEAKVDEEKKVDKPAETDLLNSEAIKGSEDTKSTQEVSKNVPLKTQKQSIVKIVKQSLVKAKKAIIGKSNNSKTPVPEVKDDGNK